MTLAYSGSVHTAPGSEYSIVILQVVPKHRFMLQKRLLYTAVTRASKSLILIGSKQLFIQGTTLNEDIPRKTCLLDYLIT